MKIKSLFKQVDEKHLNSEIDLMLWCPKMDLIALSLVTGEVCLFRLSWQKVWSLPQKNENEFISSFAWRPDGKVLAIGYTSGKCRLYTIEDASFMYEYEQNISNDKPVISMCWVSEEITNQEFAENVGSRLGELNLHDGLKDASLQYLPELPQIKNNEESNTLHNEDKMRLNGLKHLNILVVADKFGCVKVYTFGIILIGVFDVSCTFQEILNVNISDNLSTLYIIGQAKDDDKLILMTYDSTQLYKSKDEIKLVSLKLGQMITCVEYLFEVIEHVSETWEDILLEIETKLKKFAQDKFKLSGKSLRFEFLKLLLYGNPSEDLKLFLQFDLKKQAFTKLGSSVQNSYSLIQKMLLKNFTIVIDTIIFHLNSLLGLSRWKDKFTNIGLDEKSIQNALNMAGSLVIKCNEMLRVIDISIKSFKAFFKWLYPIKQKLSGDAVHPNVGNMNQQEINFVAQFINDIFAPENNLKLERVGQYLRDENLAKIFNPGENSWRTFLSSASYKFECSTKGFFYESLPESSLFQVSIRFKESLSIVTETCTSNMKNLFIPNKHLCLKYSHQTTSCDNSAVNFFVNSFNVTLPDFGQVVLYTISSPIFEKKSFFLLMKDNREGLSFGKFSFTDQKISELFNIIDISFYNENLLSLLLQDDNNPMIIQYNLGELVKHLKFMKDVACFDEVNHVVINEKLEEGEKCKILQNMMASKFAICGIRKVACVLFSSKKRVRIFLTDVDEEEDEDEHENLVLEPESALANSEAFTNFEDENSTVLDDNDKENEILS